MPWRSPLIPLLVRHADPGHPQAWTGDAWSHHELVSRWNLDNTVSALARGACREINRAEAYALTGGQP